jgi:hypothetical protein
VRGLVRLAEAFAVIPLVKKGLPEAKLAFENPAVIGVAAGASLAGTQLKRRLGGTRGELASTLVGLTPAWLTPPPVVGENETPLQETAA